MKHKGHKKKNTSPRNNNTRGRGGGDKFDKIRKDPSQILPSLIDIVKPEKKGFRAIPIIPTEKELLSLAPEPEDIPVNRIDSPYESLDEYLKTHYELLREDCLRPLREGIQAIRWLQSLTEETKETKERKEIEEAIKEAEEKIRRCMRIYERVNLVGITFANIGVIHRISFTTRHFERVNWSTSKRLLPGSLIVFSKDNFNTMKFGTVVNRSLERLEKTYDLQIEILFRLEDIEFEWSEGYIMVESTSSYFEAYRHVLNVLQELDPETLPFKEHIVDLNQEIDNPEYLQKRLPGYEFNPRKLESLYSPLRFDIREEWEKWPPVEEINLELHTSQYEALKRILTCRLALVQGPPGTGKTYVGLTAVKILLDNLSGLGTIVIACQTNHALDQFLEGIQEFETNIIRLGSRSKSNKIKSRTLFNIRQEMKEKDTRPIRNMDINRLFRKRETIESEMIELCEEIGDPLLGLDFIKEQGFLTDKQISSLKQDDWVTSNSSGDNDDNERNYIQEWLEPSIATTTSMQNDIDFQVSQLILQDSGNQTEEDDVYDEEAIQEVEAEFQATDIGQFINSKCSFVKLRSEKCIRSDIYVRDDKLDEYCSVEDLWDIPQEIRVSIHNRWRRKRLEEVCEKLKKLCKVYSELSDQIKTERIREDLLILKSARIVGMTTTAAAKYHKLLMNLAPKIMIIEEAAETLEAHIVTALTPATQHLILIGDHKQLRPNISVHELAESKNLNVSLFERLAKFLPLCQLTEQRRMRPEIRELLTPIYKDVLTDHESVNNYPDVPGFCDNLFFFDHLEKETHVDETMSKCNEFEARMCAKFANYLVKGGMDAEKITILSMYSGQRKKILQYLREDFRKTPELKTIRVSSVDGFQGEENDIILLSLVRSREAQHSIGFLGVSNRVCVALSRAKHGLYIFGNASQLKKQSELWKEVLNIFDKAGRCNQTIDLYCRKHSKTEEGPDGDMQMTQITQVSWCGDIPLEGGCSLRECGEIMECGHRCPNICHIYSHDKVNCGEKCIRTFPCGHACNKRCNEPCGKCETIIENPLSCGHFKEVLCHMSQSSDKPRCTERCSKLLRCGHQCREVCSSPWCTTKCRDQVSIRFSKCNKHVGRSLCFEAEKNLQEECPYCYL